MCNLLLEFGLFNYLSKVPNIIGKPGFYWRNIIILLKPLPVLNNCYQVRHGLFLSVLCSNFSS